MRCFHVLSIDMNEFVKKRVEFFLGMINIGKRLMLLMKRSSAARSLDFLY